MKREKPLYAVWAGDGKVEYHVYSSKGAAEETAERMAKESMRRVYVFVSYTALEPDKAPLRSVPLDVDVDHPLPF